MLIYLLYPVVVVSQWLTHLISQKKDGEATVSREEVAAMADMGEDEGVIDEDENKINFLFHTSTIPNTEVVGRLRLRQRNKYKCQEHCEDDVSHPIVNLDDSFCFFFIHTSVPTRNMVCPPLTLQKYSQDVTDVLRW